MFTWCGGSWPRLYLPMKIRWIFDHELSLTTISAWFPVSGIGETINALFWNVSAGYRGEIAVSPHENCSLVVRTRFIFALSATLDRCFSEKFWGKEFSAVGKEPSHYLGSRPCRRFYSALEALPKLAFRVDTIKHDAASSTSPLPVKPQICSPW